MTLTPEHYAQVAQAFPDTESLTVLAVAGSTRAQVVDALGLDLLDPVDEEWAGDEDETSWALLEVDNGVLAVETGGFGDPPLSVLRTLSEGGAAALVRSNILAHVRFGCARGGELLFDDNEYVFIDDPGRMPAELRPLFDRVWVDLSDENAADTIDADEGSGLYVGGFEVGLTMMCQITGVELTVDRIAQLYASPFYVAPTLGYVNELDAQ